MTEQPDGPSPFRPVKFPPWPDDGVIPGATVEDVMGLSLCALDLPAGQSAGERAAAIIDHYMVHGVDAALDATEARMLADLEGPFTGLLGPLGITPQPGIPEIAKFSSYLVISPEVLDDYQWTEAIPGMMRVALGTATPEEIAANEERRARYLAEQQVKNTEAIAEWQALREQHAGSPAIVAVLDIHRPTEDGGMIECQHPVFGYEADAEDWPCSTYLAIRDAA